MLGEGADAGFGAAAAGFGAVSTAGGCGAGDAGLGVASAAGGLGAGATGCGAGARLSLLTCAWEARDGAESEPDCCGAGLESLRRSELCPESCAEFRPGLCGLAWPACDSARTFPESCGGLGCPAA